MELYFRYGKDVGNNVHEQAGKRQGQDTFDVIAHVALQFGATAAAASHLILAQRQPAMNGVAFLASDQVGYLLHICLACVDLSEPHPPPAHPARPALLAPKELILPVFDTGDENQLRMSKLLHPREEN
jgi:hypothetical protein